MRLYTTLLVACIVVTACSKAQTVDVVRAFPSLQFNSLVGIMHANDSSNRLYALEQTGTIRVFENSQTVTAASVFLNITSRVTSGGEMGLLGLAFDPDYRNNGFLYVDYTRTIQLPTGGNQLQTVIARYSVDSTNPLKADTASELILLTINQPYQNHNGGCLAFGPDGYLYIGMGDGGGGGDPLHAGQDPKQLLGKILRIDVHGEISNRRNYGIPADNPYAGRTDGSQEEIFAIGLRNPWRFSFDPVTGKLWVGDVGQNLWEEVSIVEKGGNYGWNTMEAFHCYQPSSGCDTTGLTLPLLEYPHDTTGGQSITGGYVYRGSRVPSLVGKYIFADYVSTKIWSFEYPLGNPSIATLIRKTGFNISSFGVDANNELYICAYNGRVYMLSQTSGVDNSTEESAAEMVLHPVVPNPATRHAAIGFTLASPAHVRLTVNDATGRTVATLVDGQLNAGEHHVRLDATALAAGSYYCSLQANGRARTEPFVLVR